MQTENTWSSFHISLLKTKAEKWLYQKKQKNSRNTKACAHRSTDFLQIRSVQSFLAFLFGFWIGPLVYSSVLPPLI